jgi:hypothetical protein
VRVLGRRHPQKGDQRIKPPATLYQLYIHHQTLYSETAQSRKAEVAKFRLNTGHDLLGKHLKRFNIVDSDICKLCNVGIQDREHLRSCSILQDELSDMDDFDNMTKTEKESVCYWLARFMMA